MPDATAVPRPSGAGRIVVGIDGSPNSAVALGWAIGQARLTGQAVDAVTAWHVPVGLGMDAGVADVDWVGDAADLLHETVQKVRDAADTPPIHEHVVEGHPARALLDAANGADLLVVGSRGHGGFTGLLLGSVSQHVVTHARCPILVVHGDAAPPGPPVR